MTSYVQVGNKTDLERSRVLSTSDGEDLAVEFGVKFTETSPGMGHHIDELLVGIVMQMRFVPDPSISCCHQGVLKVNLIFILNHSLQVEGKQLWVASATSHLEGSGRYHQIS